tara:strand:+ start:578 stop:1252 length:675 start_codon:yes stop_codon:yes gene_type:complete
MKYLQTIAINTLFLALSTIGLAQENIDRDSTFMEISPIDIVVINQGIIGLSKMESEVIGQYIKDEINQTLIFKSVSNKQLEKFEYKECLEEKCLKQLSETLKVENFMFWSLKKSGNKYTGNFIRYSFPESGELNKNKVKSVRMNLKTVDVDEMILSMRMHTWKALEVKPPKGKFKSIAKNQSLQSNRLRALLVILGLIFAYGIIDGDTSSGSEPFDNPPEWPSV